MFGLSTMEIILILSIIFILFGAKIIRGFTSITVKTIRAGKAATKPTKNPQA